MYSRKASTVIVVSTIFCMVFGTTAHAGNSMGYRLLSQQEAVSLTRSGAALGMVVERSQQITDDGLTFDIMRVTQIKSGSASDRAGFRLGDQLIAVDALVFPSIAAFSSYIGSRPPGGQVTVDYIPSGGGPAQAQRMTLRLDQSGFSRRFTTIESTTPTTGMSVSKKVAIRVGAAALLGCYEFGCFSHHDN